MIISCPFCHIPINYSSSPYRFCYNHLKEIKFLCSKKAIISITFELPSDPNVWLYTTFNHTKIVKNCKIIFSSNKTILISPEDFEKKFNTICLLS